MVLNKLTRNFRLRSGVMKPFFPFFARAASSRRARTSAFLRSFSAALRFSSCEPEEVIMVGNGGFNLPRLDWPFCCFTNLMLREFKIIPQRRLIGREKKNLGQLE